MSNGMTRQERIARIEMLQAEAGLLRSAATHESIRAQAHLAIRNLEEALLYLTEDQNVGTTPTPAKVVDLGGRVGL